MCNTLFTPAQHNIGEIPKKKVPSLWSNYVPMNHQNSKTILFYAKYCIKLGTTPLPPDLHNGEIPK